MSPATPPKGSRWICISPITTRSFVSPELEVYEAVSNANSKSALCYLLFVIPSGDSRMVQLSQFFKKRSCIVLNALLSESYNIRYSALLILLLSCFRCAILDFLYQNMKIIDRTVLITGANRGIGRALGEDALRRGAKRVYAGTRVPLAHSDGRVTPLTLDVTNKRIIVVGASRGLGRGIAVALAGADARILAIGRDEGALEELRRQSQGRVEIIVGDATSFLPVKPEELGESSGREAI